MKIEGRMYRPTDMQFTNLGGTIAMGISAGRNVEACDDKQRYVRDDGAFGVSAHMQNLELGERGPPLVISTSDV
jgi:hypothetical protein